MCIFAHLALSLAAVSLLTPGARVRACLAAGWRCLKALAQTPWFWTAVLASYLWLDAGSCVVLGGMAAATSAWGGFLALTHRAGCLLTLPGVTHWWWSDPHTDLDLAALTDYEDYLSFALDTGEFALQDSVLVADAAAAGVLAGSARARAVLPVASARAR